MLYGGISMKLKFIKIICVYLFWLNIPLALDKNNFKTTNQAWSILLEHDHEYDEWLAQQHLNKILEPILKLHGYLNMLFSMITNLHNTVFETRY